MTHEHSLIKGLLDKIMEIAREEKAGKVTAVKVKIGALNFISPEHFREHFEKGAAGTLAEGSRLDIETSSDIRDPCAQDILLMSVEAAED